MCEEPDVILASSSLPVGESTIDPSLHLQDHTRGLLDSQPTRAREPREVSIASDRIDKTSHIDGEVIEIGLFGVKCSMRALKEQLVEHCFCIVDPVVGKMSLVFAHKSSVCAPHFLNAILQEPLVVERIKIVDIDQGTLAHGLRGRFQGCSSLGNRVLKPRDC